MRSVRPRCAKGARRSRDDIRCAEGASYMQSSSSSRSQLYAVILLNMQSHSREATVTLRRRGEAASKYIYICTYFVQCLLVLGELRNKNGFYPMATRL